MQDIRQETLNECIRVEQTASVVLWEIDLTEVGGERYFFCNEQNEKGEPVTWQGRKYQAYPIQGSGFEMNGKGSSARPTLKVSNLYGMVTGMAEDLQSLQTLQVFGHPGDHAIQVRYLKCGTCAAALTVHLKAASLNGVRLILSPLPGNRFTFFILLIAEKVTLPTDLCQINFPEHHAGRLLHTDAFIQCFLSYVLHQITTSSN